MSLRRRARFVGLLPVGFLLLLLSAAPLVAQSPIHYVYDLLGRLVAVVDQDGSAASYTYSPGAGTSIIPAGPGCSTPTPSGSRRGRPLTSGTTTPKAGAGTSTARAR